MRIMPVTNQNNNNNNRTQTSFKRMVEVVSGKFIDESNILSVEDKGALGQITYFEYLTSGASPDHKPRGASAGVTTALYELTLEDRAAKITFSDIFKKALLMFDDSLAKKFYRYEVDGQMMPLYNRSFSVAPPPP